MTTWSICCDGSRMVAEVYCRFLWSVSECRFFLGLVCEYPGIRNTGKGRWVRLAWQFSSVQLKNLYLIIDLLLIWLYVSSKEAEKYWLVYFKVVQIFIFWWCWTVAFIPGCRLLGMNSFIQMSAEHGAPKPNWALKCTRSISKHLHFVLCFFVSAPRWNSLGLLYLL